MLLFNFQLNDRSAQGAAAQTDFITPRQARSLCGLLLERTRRTPHGRAYCHFDAEHERWASRDWREVAAAVGRWQQALRGDGLAAGDRVAVMMNNRPEWAFFDLAALGLGLVTVPLFVNDRPENVAHILDDSGARLLLVEGAEQLAVLNAIDGLPGGLQRIVTLEAAGGDNAGGRLPGVVAAGDWLPADGSAVDDSDGGDSLATIVYTSGTTGRPKGVMLSHHNILWNAHASLMRLAAYPTDLFVSFLPLSHTLERTVGYYLPMMAGATVAYARSIPQLAEDLKTLRPTVLISVPRVFERVHGRVLEQVHEAPAARQRLFEAAVDIGWKRFEHRQGRRGWSPELALAPALDRLVGARLRARLGGRLRAVICGGAALRPEIGRFFIALGVPIAQGYGLTEASPVISVNALEDNIPESIGPALADVEVRLGERDELLVRSPGLMLGYWGLPRATAEAIDADGWLHTGDQARIEDRHLFITGRLKDVVVLANGEKVPPADLEIAIAADPLFDQVLVIGEGRPYLSALVVLNADGLKRLGPGLGLPRVPSAAVRDPSIEEVLLRRIEERLSGFPGYAQVKRVAVTEEPWSVDAGLVTPTMKLRRARIAARHAEDLAGLYAGHD